jgi:hypothetical protein
VLTAERLFLALQKEQIALINVERLWRIKKQLERLEGVGTPSFMWYPQMIRSSRQ